MKRFYFILFLLFFSCNKKEYNTLFLEIVYEDYKKDIDELKKQNIDLLKEIRSDAALDIHGYSNKYIKYLDSIQGLCTNNQSPFFYKARSKGDIRPTKVGEEFINKSNDFINYLNSITISSSLRNRALFLLNVDNIKNEKWQIIYLDYYYYNTNCKTFVFLIETRKRDALMIENQILYEILSNQYKKERKEL